jgi:hypothetical protein
MKKILYLFFFSGVFLLSQTLYSQVWQREAPDTTGHYTGEYVSLAIDSHDNPHIAYYSSDFSDLCYAYFSDGKWTTEIVDSIGTAGLDCSLVLDAQGRPHISYRQQYQGYYWKLKYATKTDSGWVKVYVDTPVDSAYFVSGYYSSIAIDGAGYPAISFVRLSPDEIRIARRDGDGWHVSKVADVFAPGYTKLVMDPSGNPVVAYTFLDNTDTVYQHKFAMARFNAGDGSWSFAEVPEPVVISNYLVGFDLDSHNTAYFAYLKKDRYSNDTLRLAVYDGNTWELETVTGDAGPYSAPGLTMKTDHAGEPAVVDFYHSEELRYYTRKDGQWSYQIANNYKKHSNPRWYVSLAFDSDDHPRIAINGTLNNRLGVLFYRFWPGSARINVQEEKHDYGKVWTESYADWDYRMENTGDAPLIVEDHDYYSPWYSRYFSVVGNPFPLILLPGEEDLLILRFTPASEISCLDTLYLSTNDSSAATVRVALSGEGVSSGSTGDLKVVVKDVYISHEYQILRHDLPLQGVAIGLYRDSLKVYGPLVSDAEGMVTFRDVDTGSYELRMVSAVEIPADPPGTVITDSARISVAIRTGPGTNTAVYLFPDSLITEKYQDIYDLTHIRRGEGIFEYTFHYPSEEDVLSLLQLWGEELPPETEDALSRLILAETMVEDMFSGGYSLGNEFFNGIGELINIVYYADSWSVAMWKWALNVVEAIFTEDVQPMLKDMLIYVLKEFLKSMIMDQVTYGIHHITAELGEPGETVFNTAWQLVRDNYSSWSIGEFSYTSWEKTIKLVNRELENPVLQGVYIDLLTDGKIEKARDYSRDFQYGGTFRDAYINKNSFVAGKLHSIENTVDICQDLRTVAMLYYATESIFTILGDFIDLLPGSEFIYAIRMAMKISAYSSVLTAMGISGYSFVTLPGDLNRAVDDIYLQDGRKSGVGPGYIFPYQTGQVIPEVFTALEQNLLEQIAVYDSVLSGINDLISEGDAFAAVEKLNDLMQAEGDLQSSYLAASAPFQSVAVLAKDHKGGFQTAYDSLETVYAKAGETRMVNYLSVLFAPFDTSQAMRDSVVAGLEKTSAMNHAVKDQILTVLNTVTGMEIPAVIVPCRSAQDKFGLRTGETATLQLQVMNAGALTAHDVYVVLRCNAALQPAGSDSIFIGDLAPGARSDVFVFTVAPANTAYTTGVWEAGISSSNAKTYSAGGTFTMHDAVSGVTEQPEERPADTYAYPNPFNPSQGPVTIHYRLATASRVTIRIYDMKGNIIRMLDDLDRISGTTEHTARWDGRDASGNSVAEGMYVYTVEWGKRHRTAGRIIVIK